MAAFPTAAAPAASAPMAPVVPPASITGVVLAGGRGTRMGGRDKGLQPWQGVPLAHHALERLQPQVAGCMLSANRHLENYAAWGVPVVPDTMPGFAGPLAGLAAALQHCSTPYLVSVPCDVPRFPRQLVQRLAEGLARSGRPIALAVCPQDASPGAPMRRHPTFCLLHTGLRGALEAYLAQGGRRLTDWMAAQDAAEVPFDDPAAFANANTLAELQALQP